MDHTTFFWFSQDSLTTVNDLLLQIHRAGLTCPTAEYCWATCRCGVHAFTSGKFVLTQKWTFSFFLTLFFLIALQWVAKKHDHSPSLKREQGNIHFDCWKPRSNVLMVSQVYRALDFPCWKRSHNSSIWRLHHSANQLLISQVRLQ